MSDHESESEGVTRIKAEMLADPESYARLLWLAGRKYRNPQFLRALAQAQEEARRGDLGRVSSEDFLASLQDLTDHKQQEVI